MVEGDGDFALRMILHARDDLRAGGIASDGLRRVWDRRARLVDDVRFDTLFRGIVAHEFGQHPPAWATGAGLQASMSGACWESRATGLEFTASWEYEDAPAGRHTLPGA